MPRPFAIALFFLPPIAMAGCPVYGRGCVENGRDYDCAPGYVCSQNECVAKSKPVPGPGRCHDTSECRLGQICDRYNRCVDESNGTAGEGGVPGSAGVGGQR